MSWFLKYRPHQIADLDLTDVRESLLSLMKNGQFPQTLLFAGPKGTGKTSASRIIGAMLNDPANEVAIDALFFKKTGKKLALNEPDPGTDFAQRVFRGQSYVVQEMDAASHRGIDDIRQLRERVGLPPQEGKMAVYILDEVHMLTKEAFNALLKILEEPPAHVIFILATTELSKVPPTIISRCNLISFHKASLDELVNRLKKILKKEKIKFEEEALIEIARRADGSFRDAVKLSEMAAQTGEVTLAKIDQLIGGSALVEVKKLMELILIKDEAGIGQFFQSLRQRNFDQDYFYQSFFEFLHHNLLAAIGAIEAKVIYTQNVVQFLLNQLITVDLKQNTPIPYLPFELKILAIVQRAKSQSNKSGGNNSGKTKTQPSKIVQSKINKNKKASSNKKVAKIKKEAAVSNGRQNSAIDRDLAEEVKEEVLPRASSLKSNEVTAISATVSSDETIHYDDSLSQKLTDHWEDFLKMVETKNTTLAALLRSGQCQAGPNGMAQINVFYSFHQEQLRQPKYRAIIEACGQNIIGDKIGFKFVLCEAPVAAELVDLSAKTESLENLAEAALM